MSFSVLTGVGQTHAMVSIHTLGLVVVVIGNGGRSHTSLFMVSATLLQSPPTAEYRQYSLKALIAAVHMYLPGKLLN